MGSHKGFVAGLRAVLCTRRPGADAQNRRAGYGGDGRMLHHQSIRGHARDQSLRERPIEGLADPVVDDAGIVIGMVVFRDARAPAYSEQEREIDAHLSRAKGIINLCAWCKKVPDEEGNWRDLETFIADHSCIYFTSTSTGDYAWTAWERGVFAVAFPVVDNSDQKEPTYNTTGRPAMSLG